MWWIDDMMDEVPRSLMDQWMLDAVMSPIDGGAHHFEVDCRLVTPLSNTDISYPAPDQFFIWV
jgi:hypothetical protein